MEKQFACPTEPGNSRGEILLAVRENLCSVPEKLMTPVPWQCCCTLCPDRAQLYLRMCQSDNYAGHLFQDSSAKLVGPPGKFRGTSPERAQRTTKPGTQRTSWHREHRYFRWGIRRAPGSKTEDLWLEHLALQKLRLLGLQSHVSHKTDSAWEKAKIPGALLSQAAATASCKPLALSISGGRGCKALGGSSSLTGHPQNPKRTHKPRTLSTHPSRSQKNGTTATEPCTKERKPWDKQAARTALPRPSRACSSVEALASHASAAPHTARCAPTSRTMKTLIVNLCRQDDSTRGSVQNLLRNPPPFQPATLAPRFWGAPPPCYPVLPSSSIGEFNTHRPVRGRRRLGWCLTWSPDIFEHFIAWGDNDDIAQKVHTCASPPSPPLPLVVSGYGHSPCVGVSFHSPVVEWLGLGVQVA